MMFASLRSHTTVGAADRFGEKKFTCPMCGKSVDLDRDGTSDEGGKVMHAECYFKRVGGQRQSPPENRHSE
jgi:predicted RNA-binding Zn-ribbon protein involved in translation (DUF1610 family)